MGVSTALLLIDVVNPLEFEGGDDFLREARPAARRIAALQQRAHASGVPSIFVNDNFDCWHLGFREIVARVRNAEGPGKVLLDDVTPDFRRDYFVLKPMHSGFFHTSLEVLLRRLEIRRLVLTGFAGDICVLFTAVDAHMRGFELAVPIDCVASARSAGNRRALEQMQRLLAADIRPSSDLSLGNEPIPVQRRRRKPRGRVRGGA
jgi:nicotinamidase-related amidase